MIILIRNLFFCHKSEKGDVRRRESLTPPTAAFLILVLFALPVSADKPSVDSPVPVRYAWEHTLQDLEKLRDRFAGQLETTHRALLIRAQREAPELVPRVSLQPPRARPQGYAIVPTVEEDEPPARVEMRRKTYSLAVLRNRVKRALRGAEALLARAQTKPAQVLEPMVEELERLRGLLRNLETHLSYHAKWQQAVIDWPKFFAERNRIVSMVEELASLRANGTPLADIAALRQPVEASLATFAPTPGLATAPPENGIRVLPVIVHTDIEDESFLATFRESVEGAFIHSAAARASGFAIELDIRRIAPAQLYPEGVPARAATIDIKGHIARFPPGALVLTTGAKSTHAWTGRYIVLGPAPLTRNTLAHEFGHLLGFRDAYLRGYDGDPRDPLGVTLVEWTGLVDNLMGSPGQGRVTETMIEQLIEAYDAR